MTEFQDPYKSRIVAITGGTGSFGGQFARRLMKTDVQEIRVVSRDEAKQDAMRHELQDKRLRFFLGDVRDPDSLRTCFRGADYIMHAAALKQVPSCEAFPEQAVATNVLGSYNVLDQGVRSGVKRVICISTDKAVYPINAMGMTKALMEKLVRAKAQFTGTETILSCVRYGNVVSSRGSVVPVFIDQIQRGRPITITDPTMTRFLLTLDEAVELIDFAIARANSGDVFVRKSPAATVDVVAEALSELFDVRLVTEIIGIRPGEKLHETLCTFAERAAADESAEFLRIPISTPSSNTEDTSDLRDFTSDRTRRLGKAEVVDLLKTIPTVLRAAQDFRSQRQ